MKRIFTYCAAWLLVVAPAMAGERAYVNEKKYPESREDILAIQESLMKHLEQARAATVCIRLEQGSGSGVIVSADGLVLTAAHVSGGVRKRLKVVMEDGREFEARSLGLNAKNDAAMLQIVSDEKFPFVALEEPLEKKASSSRMGDWVFSLGHSGGFDDKRGSVVRLGRVVRVAKNTLHSDCTLIGGDSGGPLFDLNGVLIGIHSRVGTKLAQNMHVPVQVFHAHWEALKEAKFIGRGPFAKREESGSGMMGMAVEATAGGLRVTAVEPKYPADLVGIKKGDILTEIEGEKIKDKEALKRILSKYAAGDSLQLSYKRGDGAENSVELTLTKR